MWIMKTMTMLMSGYMIYSKNQMLMVSMIIFMCILLALWMFFISSIQWFSVLLLLIYISGVMVLFMFIVSLSPNEKTPLKKNKNQAMLLFSMVYLSKYFFSSENSKISSSFEQSVLPMALIMLVIMLMAYLPPKVIKSFYKGMKSTK